VSPSRLGQQGSVVPSAANVLDGCLSTPHLGEAVETLIIRRG